MTLLFCFMVVYIIAILYLLQMFFEDNIDDAKYCGHLYGLGTSYVNGGQAYSGPSSNSNTNSS